MSHSFDSDRLDTSFLLEIDPVPSHPQSMYSYSHHLDKLEQDNRLCQLPDFLTESSAHILQLMVPYSDVKMQNDNGLLSQILSGNALQQQSQL